VKGRPEMDRRPENFYRSSSRNTEKERSAGAGSARPEAITVGLLEYATRKVEKNRKPAPFLFGEFSGSCLR